MPNLTNANLYNNINKFIKPKGENAGENAITYTKNPISNQYSAMFLKIWNILKKIEKLQEADKGKRFLRKLKYSILSSRYEELYEYLFKEKYHLDFITEFKKLNTEEQTYINNKLQTLGYENVMDAYVNNRNKMPRELKCKNDCIRDEYGFFTLYDRTCEDYSCHYRKFTLGGGRRRLHCSKTKKQRKHKNRTIKHHK